MACLYGSTYMDTRDRQIHGQTSCVLPGNIDRMEVFNISMVTDAFTQSTIRALRRTINKESFHPQMNDIVSSIQYFILFPKHPLV